ncbi:hypothetical protein IKQ21_09915 [bacterium]|nr:hypothetical protein [bacterium]
MDIKNRLPALTKAGVSEKALKQTYKYQKIYGFNMGTGEHGTHNNDADAFKHAFMQAYATICVNRAWAKFGGDIHEFVEGFGDSLDERNMDLWNNSIGREVAHDLKSFLGNKYNSYSIDELSNMASDMIVDKMRNGELITNPDDKRNFKNMLYDRLQDKDRIFYEGEYWDAMDEDERKRFSEHYANYKSRVKGKFPTKAELITKTLIGDYIYVHNYTRGDGTKVSGYYRRRVIY